MTQIAAMVVPWRIVVVDFLPTMDILKTMTLYGKNGRHKMTKLS